jgi:hypothetical protein
MRRIGTWTIAATLLLAMTAGAADQPAPGASVRDALTKQAGKAVTLSLRGGQEVAGTVETVGDQVVHVSRLKGREFYDAVIRLDAIDGVVIRAREQ